MVGNIRVSSAEEYFSYLATFPRETAKFMPIGRFTEISPREYAQIPATYGIRLPNADTADVKSCHFSDRNPIVYAQKHEMLIRVIKAERN